MRAHKTTQAYNGVHTWPRSKQSVGNRLGMVLLLSAPEQLLEVRVQAPHDARKRNGIPATSRITLVSEAIGEYIVSGG